MNLLQLVGCRKDRAHLPNVGPMVVLKPMKRPMAMKKKKMPKASTASMKTTTTMESRIAAERKSRRYGGGDDAGNACGGRL